MNLAAIIKLVTAHEGSRATVYTDTTGNQTVGVGCNLSSPNAADDLSGVDFNLADVLAGKPLTQDQIDGLLLIQLNRAIYQAQILLPQLEDYPENVQSVVVDMVFNLGMRGFGLFKNCLASIKFGKWNDAANDLKYSKWWSQTNPRDLPESTVGNRACDNVRMMREAA